MWLLVCGLLGLVGIRFAMNKISKPVDVGSHEPLPFSSHRDALSKSHFDVIILGSSFTSLVLAAILSIIGRRVLILERSNSGLYGSSSKSLSNGSAATEFDASLLYFGCCGWIFLLLCGLVGDGCPDALLKMEELGRSGTSPYLHVKMGHKTVCFPPDGTGSPDIPAPLLEELQHRSYVGAVSMLVLQLLPRWVSASPPPDGQASDDCWSLSARLNLFWCNVLRRIHTGSSESLQAVAGETSEDFVKRYTDDPTLRSILSGGQSIVEGETQQHNNHTHSSLPTPHSPLLSKDLSIIYKTPLPSIALLTTSLLPLTIT